MIPPIVGVTVDHLHGTPRPWRLSAESGPVRCRQRAAPPAQRV